MVFSQKIRIIGRFPFGYFFFSLLLLVSCRVGPDYEPPCWDMPGEWISSKEASSDEQNPWVSTHWVPKRWWETLGDPLLCKYIEESALCNRNIQVALLNITISRSQRTIAASRLYPTIDFDQRYDRNSFNLFGIGGFAEEQPNIPPIVTNNQQEIIFAGLDSFWELDVFGRTRRDVEAASARLGSACENYRDVLITVFGEVAKNYLEVRSNQEKILITWQQIELFEESLKLIEQNTDAGIFNQIQLHEIKAELEKAKAAIALLYSDMYGAIFRLATLLGRFPEQLIEEIKIERPLPEVPEILATGIPGEVLRRRPDIRKAERELAAATADIGVAVGEFFPRFSLFGSIGYQKFKTEAFTDEGFVWSYSTLLLKPIFNAGKLMANVRAKRAAANQAFYSYEQTVLQTIEEAETALMNFVQAKNRIVALESQKEEIGNICRLTDDLYQSGTNDYLSVLNAKQQCLEAENQWIESKASALFSLVTFYKVLGGGWDFEDDAIDICN